MVENTTIWSLSLPLFLWAPPLLLEPCCFRNDSITPVVVWAPLTSAGSPPVLRVLPHFCGHSDIAGSAYVNACYNGEDQEF